MSGTPSREKIQYWLSEPLGKDVRQSLERLAELEDVARIAVMPDVHLANEICVGTVVATRGRLIPAAVGGDIGCGMAALCFDATAELLGDEMSAGRVLDGLYRTVPAMRHSRATMRERLPDELERQLLSDSKLEKLKRRDGLVQLGTLGRGNHFLEFQSDAEGRLWLMIHSGSRAMGQAITSNATRRRGDGETRGGRHEEDRGEGDVVVEGDNSHLSGLVLLDAESAAGRAYLQDVAWARKYASANRLAMMEAVVGLMKELFGVEADMSSLIHSDHNHVRAERHFGEDLWVHRKGALSAKEDEPGIIPGSMGDSSFHVAGNGHEAALASSSHGAGRALSRTDARKTVGRKELERQMHGVWFDHRRAEQLRDEAPSAYKNIRRVMRAQRELTRIVRELRPILSYKGS
jgi:tRNA-splicing ligase RtcB